MTDKTHQLIGLTAATAAFITMYPHTALTWPLAGTILFGSFLGSIAPDIDQPTSGFWEAVPFGDFVGGVTARAMGGHRNFSHSLLGLFAFCYGIKWLSGSIPDNWFLEPTLFWQTFAIGFIAHLLADAVTVMGIPLLWPWGDYVGIPPRPFQGLRVMTGKWFENLIVFPATGLLLIALVLNNFPLFCPIIPVLCRMTF